MSVNPKFAYHEKRKEYVFQNVDLTQLLSHAQPACAAPPVQAVPVVDQDEPAAAARGGGLQLLDLFPEADERPACSSAPLQTLHVLVCTVAVLYYQLCVFGATTEDLMLLLPLAAYLGWHSRVPAHAAQDTACLYTGIMTAAWCGFARGRAMRSYAMFSLALYLAAHLLQRRRVYGVLCAAIVHLMFFGLSVALPDPKMVLCLWGMLVYATGLLAVPRVLF